MRPADVSDPLTGAMRALEDLRPNMVSGAVAPMAAIHRAYTDALLAIGNEVRELRARMAAVVAETDR